MGIALLEKLGDIYANYIQKHPEESYTITCFGYTNSTKVKGKIPYVGEGRLSKTGTQLSLDIHEGDSIPLEITNNGQLSYARAYSGIAYLAKYMQAVHGAILKDSEVEFNYVGMGVDQSIKHDTNTSKRIEIKIK